MPQLRARSWLISIVALAAASCADVAEREYVNEGALCIRTQAADGSTMPDASTPWLTRVDIVFDGCASYCADIVAARCSVEQVGEEWIIESYARTEEVIERNSPCPTACLVVAASCEIGTLPAGNYRFRHGEQVFDQAIPVTEPCDEQ